MASYRGKKGYKIPIYVIVDEDIDVDEMTDTVDDAVYSALYNHDIWNCGIDNPKEVTDMLESDIDYLLD